MEIAMHVANPRRLKARPRDALYAMGRGQCNPQQKKQAATSLAMRVGIVCPMAKGISAIDEAHAPSK